MREKSGRESIVSFTFNERTIECDAGVSVAAALASAGEFHLRTMGEGDRRGVFCGMGVCQECRVNIDGLHGVRACMTSVRPGMKIRRDGMPEVAKSPTIHPSQTQNESVEPELLVIGGGAGGLTAAAIAAEAGVDVVLLDERTTEGGQYFKQPAIHDLLPGSLVDDSQIKRGRQLLERAAGSGAKIVNRAEVWGAFAPGEFAVVDDTGSTIYRPKKTIVATGAYERGMPLPGWTLPGVMTTGAAQGMLRNYGRFPAGRIIIAGNGPLNLQIALELKRAGADVLRVAELSDASALTWGASGLKMALNVPAFALDGVGYLRGLRRADVPVRFGECLTGITSSPNGLEVSVGRIRGGTVERAETIEADVVCMGYGFQPSNEILRCLDCSHHFDSKRGHLVTVRSEECETTMPGIYAVGDCAGLSGAPAAMQDGTLAAVAVIRSLDYPVSAEHESERRRALRARPRHRAFQSALWTLFHAPRFSTQLAAEKTVVCRCEKVTLGDIEAAVDDGAETLAGIKQRTRLGMGPCQGRYCAPVAADFLAERTGQAVDEYSYFAPRPPIKPVRIADIIGHEKT
jgi:thioredoxin reductase/bacterioferritin-associated ferredoxin